MQLRKNTSKGILDYPVLIDKCGSSLLNENAWQRNNKVRPTSRDNVSVRGHEEFHKEATSGVVE